MEKHRTNCMEKCMTREQQTDAELHWHKYLKWESMESPFWQALVHTGTHFTLVRACLCTNDTQTNTHMHTYI